MRFFKQDNIAIVRQDEITVRNCQAHIVVIQIVVACKQRIIFIAICLSKPFTDTGNASLQKSFFRPCRCPQNIVINGFKVSICINNIHCFQFILIYINKLTVNRRQVLGQITAVFHFTYFQKRIRNTVTSIGSKILIAFVCNPRNNCTKFSRINHRAFIDIFVISQSCSIFKRFCRGIENRIFNFHLLCGFSYRHFIQERCFGIFPSKICGSVYCF